MYEALFYAFNSPEAHEYILPNLGFLFILDEQMRKLVESSLENDITNIVRDFFANYHDSILHSNYEREHVNLNYELPERVKTIFSEITSTTNRTCINEEPIVEEIQTSDIILDDDDIPF